MSGRSPVARERRLWRAALPPEVDVEVGRTVPGRLLLVGTALLTTALLLVGWGTRAPVSAAAVLVALVVGGLAVALPEWPVVPVGLVLVGVAALTAGEVAPGTVAALVLLGHVVLWLSGLVARVTWRARVEVRVLTAELRPLVVVQVAAQLLAVLAVALGRADVTAGDVVRVVGVLAAAGVALLVLPRARR